MCIYVNTEYWPEYSSKKYLCGFAPHHIKLLTIMSYVFLGKASFTYTCFPSNYTFPDFTSKSSEMTDRIHHAGIIPSTSLLLVTGSRNLILNLVLKNFAAVKTFLNIF